VRVVLDANVLVAAFGTRGLCEALVDACLGAHELILSAHILDELRRHLAGKFKMSGEHTEEIVAFLREHAELVEPAPVPPEAFEDPGDLPVLGTAAAGRADCLVTGVRKLLALSTYRGAAILSPRAFYDRLR